MDRTLPPMPDYSLQQSNQLTTIENTLKYVQLAEELFKNEIFYVSKVPKTEGEACVLIDAGFDFVCDFDGHKLFRKMKF